MSTTAAYGAILLAGGRASRIDGAAKPLLEIDGRTMLQRAVAAAHSVPCAPLTIVGPVLDPALAVSWILEDPPFGGPAAAIVAALASWPEPAPEWTVLLACDLPRAEQAVTRLVADAALVPADTDGVCLADASSRPQWLTGIYRTRALRAGASALADRGRGAPVRALLADLAIAVIADPDGDARDVDTWEDLEQAQERAAHARSAGAEETTMTAEASRTLPPEALDDWAAALRERFDLAPDDLPISLILDLARDVANGVARPAAPFSAFVAGLVAGREGATPADTAAAVASITELAQGWSTEK